MATDSLGVQASTPAVSVTVGNLSIAFTLRAATVASTATGLSVTYPSPGTYPTTITASDAGGHNVSKSFVVVVQDPVQLDQQFKAVWNGMNNALIAGDKATAMNSLSSSAQAIYGPVFEALITEYQQIISTWSAPITGTLSSQSGEYAIITTGSDGVRQLFLINLVKGADGVWRLESM